MNSLFKLLPFIILTFSVIGFFIFFWFPYFRKHLIEYENQKAWKNDWEVYFFTDLGEGHTYAYESKFVAWLAFLPHVITPGVQYSVHPPDDFFANKKAIEIRKNHRQLITMINPESNKRLYTYIG